MHLHSEISFTSQMVKLERDFVRPSDLKYENEWDNMIIIKASEWLKILFNGITPLYKEPTI